MTLQGSILHRSSVQLSIPQKPDDEIHAREGLRTVLREHRCDDVDDDSQFRLVRSGDVYEYITGIQRDFTVFGVDDWRHRCDYTFGVVDDWVHGRVTDDVKVPRKVLL